jgi:hypothetical protein
LIETWEVNEGEAEGREGDTDRKKTGRYTEGETQNRKETEGRVVTETEGKRHRERHWGR